MTLTASITDSRKKIFTFINIPDEAKVIAMAQTGRYYKQLTSRLCDSVLNKQLVHWFRYFVVPVIPLHHNLWHVLLTLQKISAAGLIFKTTWINVRYCMWSQQFGGGKARYIILYYSYILNFNFYTNYAGWSRIRLWSCYLVNTLNYLQSISNSTLWQV